MKLIPLLQKEKLKEGYWFDNVSISGETLINSYSVGKMVTTGEVNLPLFMNMEFSGKLSINPGGISINGRSADIDIRAEAIDDVEESRNGLMIHLKSPFQNATVYLKIK